MFSVLMGCEPLVNGGCMPEGAMQWGKKSDAIGRKSHFIGNAPFACMWVKTA